MAKKAVVKRRNNAIKPQNVRRKKNVPRLKRATVPQVAAVKSAKVAIKRPNAPRPKKLNVKRKNNVAKKVTPAVRRNRRF